MSNLHLAIALLALVMYVRFELRSPFVNSRTSGPGTILQRLMPLFGLVTSVALTQMAVLVDSSPYSFVLLAIGALVLMLSTVYAIVRRLR